MVFLRAVIGFLIKKNKEKRLKKERIEKINIIAQKMVIVFKNDYQLEESFNRISLLRGLHHSRLPENLYRIFFMSGSKLFFEANKKSFQNFFDQLLKVYAEPLKLVYEKEEEMREKYKDTPYNSFSSEEIRDLFKIKKGIGTEKEHSENDFWSLHDALKHVGFDVWGEKKDGFGHKAYLCLKKSYLF
jgi:hypothetical protein